MLRSSIDSFNGKKDELESQIAETKQALAAAEEAAAAEAEAEEAAAAGAATALAEQKHKGRKEKGKAVAATASAVYIDRKELDDIKAVLRNLALLYKKRLKRTQRMVKGAYICLYFTFLELLTFWFAELYKKAFPEASSDEDESDDDEDMVNSDADDDTPTQIRRNTR